MNRALKISVIGISTFIFCLISAPLSAQQSDTSITNFKLSGFLNSGYEHNIFYSPTSLRMADGSQIGKDSLIRSGGFATAGINFSIIQNTGKKTFSINSSNYYKNYFTKSLRRFDNQNFSLTPAFQYNFKKSDFFRFEAALVKNKITRALTLDEESIIPLSYYRVNPLLSYQRLLFNKVSTQVNFGYDLRKYKESTNGLDFSYGEILLGAGAKYRQKLKKSILLYKVDYSYTNRKYTNWSSQEEESSGTFDENDDENWEEEESSNNKQNQWAYHRLAFNVSAKLNRNFVTGLTLSTTQKKDVADADFGFKEYQLGLDLAYRRKSFSVSLKSGMSQRKYTTRRSISTNEESPLLNYNYLNNRLRLDYKLTKNFSANINFLTRVRTSNSTEISRMTRRNYSYYSITGGIAYTLKHEKKKAIIVLD